MTSMCSRTFCAFTGYSFSSKSGEPQEGGCTSRAAHAPPAPPLQPYIVVGSTGEEPPAGRANGSQRMPRNDDLHGNAPDSHPLALLLVDVINPCDFAEADDFLRHALPAA